MPIIKTQSGIDALEEMSPEVKASLIAAIGPTELAMSLAPWAKLIYYIFMTIYASPIRTDLTWIN